MATLGVVCGDEFHQDPFMGHCTNHVRDESDDEELRRALAASAKLFDSTECKRAEARKRLMQAAELHQMMISKCQADGNCQFRALSVALFGSEDRHGTLRAKVVQQMRASPQDYAQFVDEPYTNYLDRMARDGEWGDNVTLQAASDALNRRLQVLTDVPGADCIMVYPKQLRSTEGLVQQPLWSLQEPICIAFLTEWHYDAALVIKRPIGTIVHM